MIRSLKFRIHLPGRLYVNKDLNSGLFVKQSYHFTSEKCQCSQINYITEFYVSPTKQAKGDRGITRVWGTLNYDKSVHLKHFQHTDKWKQCYSTSLWPPLSGDPSHVKWTHTKQSWTAVCCPCKLRQDLLKCYSISLNFSAWMQTYVTQSHHRLEAENDKGMFSLVKR